MGIDWEVVMLDLQCPPLYLCLQHSGYRSLLIQTDKSPVPDLKLKFVVDVRKRLHTEQARLLFIIDKLQ
jgi:hypothetical protein